MGLESHGVLAMNLSTVYITRLCTGLEGCVVLKRVWYPDVGCVGIKYINCAVSC